MHTLPRQRAQSGSGEGVRFSVLLGTNDVRAVRYFEPEQRVLKRYVSLDIAEFELGDTADLVHQLEINNFIIIRIESEFHCVAAALGSQNHVDQSVTGRNRRQRRLEIATNITQPEQKSRGVAL